MNTNSEKDTEKRTLITAIWTASFSLLKYTQKCVNRPKISHFFAIKMRDVWSVENESLHLFCVCVCVSQCVCNCISSHFKCVAMATGTNNCIIIYSNTCTEHESTHTLTCTAEYNTRLSWSALCPSNLCGVNMNGIIK